MSKRPFERTFDALMREEIRKLNVHLPRGKKTLRQLLLEDEPSVEAVDGSQIIFRKDELNRLAEMVPRDLQDKVRLPLVVLRRMDLGKSVYVILGEKVEQFLVKRVLGLTEFDFDKMERDREQLYLYRPQVSELVRMYHSLVVIGFGTTADMCL